MKPISKILLRTIVLVTLAASLPFVPFIFYYNLSGIPITILLCLPIIAGITASYFGGIAVGAVYGFIIYAIAKYHVGFNAYLFTLDDYQLFDNLVVTLVPQISMGFLSAFFYRAFRGVLKKQYVCISLVTVLTLTLNAIIFVVIACTIKTDTSLAVYGDDPWMVFFFDRNNMYNVLEIILNLLMTVSICFIFFKINDKYELYKG